MLITPAKKNIYCGRDAFGLGAGLIAGLRQRA